MQRRKFAAHNPVQKFNPLTYKSIETHPHILEACVVSECRVIVVVITEAVVMCLSFNACADQQWQDWACVWLDTAAGWPTGKRRVIDDVCCHWYHKAAGHFRQASFMLLSQHMRCPSHVVCV